MAEAMVKGLGITDIVASLEKALEEGRVTRDRLEAELEAVDLDILDTKVDPNLWYPVAAMGRMLRITSELDAGGDRARVQAISRAAATRFMERPSFQGLVNEAKRRGGRNGELLLALPKAVFGFGTWRYEDTGGPTGGPRVVFEDCAPLPELVPYTTAGVMEGLTSAVAGREVRVVVDRPVRDRVHFDFFPI